MRHKHYILQFLAYQKAGNLEGSMMEFYAGLEYRLFKPFALEDSTERMQTFQGEATEIPKKIRIDLCENATYDMWH